MTGGLETLITWCTLPVRGGFAELDAQINKLRKLRDSYQTPFQNSPDDRSADVNKDRNLLRIRTT